MLSELDQAIAQYADGLMRRGFTEAAHSQSVRYGHAERLYVLDHVLLKAVYERGLMYLEVGCASQPDRMIEASRVRDLLEPPAQGHWNLGMAAAEFLNSRWEQVRELVTPSKWPQTLRSIEGAEGCNEWDEGGPIPGHVVIAKWKPEPTRPLKVVEADKWRWMQGSWGPPAYVVVRDAAGRAYEFGFDSFLCRLFAGARNESDDDAAWVVHGSALETEFTALVRAAVVAHTEWSWLTRYIDKALSWGPAVKEGKRH
jgi:hypothetical protein